MSIRVRKTLDSSFVLDEPELRRINQVLTEQMALATKNNDFTTTFNLKLKNQMSFEKTSLEDVLSESNGGQQEIQELGISFVGKTSHEEISLEFSKERFTPIIYRISNNDRNWVSITQSIIEERIRNLKPAFTIAGKLRIALEIFQVFILIIIIATSLAILISRTSNISQPGSIVVSLRDVIIFLIALILIEIGIFSYLYFFPSQNFYWGDYVKVYQRRQSIGKFILITVIIGLVLNVFGSIIASYFLTK